MIDHEITIYYTRRQACWRMICGGKRYGACITMGEGIDSGDQDVIDMLMQNAQSTRKEVCKELKKTL